MVVLNWCVAVPCDGDVHDGSLIRFASVTIVMSVMVINNRP